MYYYNGDIRLAITMMTKTLKIVYRHRITETQAHCHKELRKFLHGNKGI